MPSPLYSLHNFNTNPRVWQPPHPTPLPLPPFPTQADQICYAVLCVFSYMAAGQQRPAPAPRRAHHPAGGLSPRGHGQASLGHGQAGLGHGQAGLGHSQAGIAGHS